MLRICYKDSIVINIGVSVIVHNKINIIVSLQCQSIFSCVILHQNLFLQAKQCYNRAVFPLGVQF